jgi:hypothetical protein
VHWTVALPLFETIGRVSCFLCKNPLVLKRFSGSERLIIVFLTFVQSFSVGKPHVN